MTGAQVSTELVPGVDPGLNERVVAGLGAVDTRLQQVIDHEDEFIAGAARYLSDAGGKRFRPMLTLLAAQVGPSAGDVAEVSPQVVDAAVGVELTHLASLYHDDVMDEADLRRGVPSANVAFDNSTSILIGDLLFGVASKVISGLGAEAVGIQADTFVRLCAGQIRDDRPVPESVDPVDHYLGVLADKTGALIATAARYGAMFGGCDAATVALLTEYGEKIGVVFQLADDLLDISSEAGESGKTPGTDLREGKATLPVLIARASTDPADERLRQLLAGPIADDRELTEALDLLRRHPAMEAARAHTLRVADEARATLAPLGERAAVQALRALVDGVALRSS